MELREKIAKIVWERTEVQSGNNVADAILALPEFQEMREKKEAYDNAMAQTHYCQDCKAPILEQKVLQAEVEQWREKAERWDAQQQTLDVLLTDIRKDLTTVFSGLVVEEKCSRCGGRGWYLYQDDPMDTSSASEEECFCKHGIITRPATLEEVREMIEWCFAPQQPEPFTKDAKLRQDEKGWYFLLASGGKLRKEKL